MHLDGGESEPITDLTTRCGTGGVGSRRFRTCLRSASVPGPSKPRGNCAESTRTTRTGSSRPSQPKIGSTGSGTNGSPEPRSTICSTTTSPRSPARPDARPHGVAVVRRPGRHLRRLAGWDRGGIHRGHLATAARRSTNLPFTPCRWRAARFTDHRRTHRPSNTGRATARTDDSCCSGFQRRSRLLRRPGAAWPTSTATAGTETVLTENWDRSASGWEWIGRQRASCSQPTTRRGSGCTRPTSAARLPNRSADGGATHGPRPSGDLIWCRYEDSTRPPEVAVVDRTASGGSSAASTTNCWPNSR